MDEIANVPKGKEQEIARATAPTTTTSSIGSLIPTTATVTTDPWMLFLYALKAPATRDKYIQRLIKFLDSLGYPGTNEEKAGAFADQARAGMIAS
jgi:hypothetical protein